MGVLENSAPAMEEKEVLAVAEAALEDIGAIRKEIGAVIFGQQSVVEHTLLTILSGGHALLVGVPGLAKTKLVATLGTVLGLGNNRIQFTPDLMPSDILGSEVMDQDEGGKRTFRFVAGPVFTQLLMADEINRASPRTQSALLQAMQEYHVTIAGHDHALPQPFHVLATQNPLEQEGTYPLPEAQLDRFLMQVDVPYPEQDAERRILLETTGIEEATAKPVLSGTRIQEIQALVRRMPVSEQVVDAILALVRAARPGNGIEETDRNVAWGPGPRAGQSMMLCVRARALYDGRLAPSVDDVYALAQPILQHRMALTFAARAEGVHIRDVISALVKKQGGAQTCMAPIGQTVESVSVSDALARARQRAFLVPDLLVEAQRVANTVIAGWHGRRKRGIGENFWQFRPYVEGESLARIDWRRSARDDHTYVRDREWEAAHTVWLWADNSPSMLFGSSLASVSKQSRATVLLLAIAEVLARSGERIACPGVMDPVSARNASERLAAALDLQKQTSGLPDLARIGRYSDVVLISDFLDPPEAVIDRLSPIAKRGIRGHLLEICDPVEESFPYTGRTEFVDPESGEKLTAGKAETVHDDYRNAFLARRETLAEAMRRFGWSFMTHHTDQPASTALVALHTHLSGLLGDGFKGA